MTRDLSRLAPEFRESVEVLLKRCLDRGVEMVPYCTIRTPAEQARLWRQSRSGATVRAKIAEFRKSAPFLAAVLGGVGPQFGRHVTNAPPGLSWHQWGEAVDCYWLVEGKAEWSARRQGAKNGYRIYAGEAESTPTALEAGGWWTSLKDWPHVQRVAGGVRLHRAMAEINDVMSQRFAGT